MKHLKGSKTGIKAEVNLMNMIKGNRNKHRYVSTKLADFNKIIRLIITTLNNDNTDLIKYMLSLHKDKFIEDVYQSKLSLDEQRHLHNAIKTRYMIAVRKIKLPLNNGTENKS